MKTLHYIFNQSALFSVYIHVYTCPDKCTSGWVNIVLYNVQPYLSTSGRTNLFCICCCLNTALCASEVEYLSIECVLLSDLREDVFHLK